MADKTFTIKITNNKTGEVIENSTDCFALSTYIDEERGWNAWSINAPSAEIIDVLLHLDELQKVLMTNLSGKDLKKYEYMRFGKLLCDIMGDTENDDETETSPKNLC